ncbi:MAG: hypothetical protein HY270_23815 [Deltaproteobacteria bacterium]|nr:hypothetical protein [Deltaproteobacteria bacterium]
MVWLAVFVSDEKTPKTIQALLLAQERIVSCHDARLPGLAGGGVCELLGH